MIGFRVRRLIRRRTRRQRERAENAEMRVRALEEIVTAQREWIHSRQNIDAVVGASANQELQRLQGKVR